MYLSYENRNYCIELGSTEFEFWNIVLLKTDKGLIAYIDELLCTQDDGFIFECTSLAQAKRKILLRR